MKMFGVTVLVLLGTIILGVNSSYYIMCEPRDDMNPTKYYPDDEDCAAFWQCLEGKLKRFNCPAGLHFNAKLNTCDWPQAGCDSPCPRPGSGTPVPNGRCPATSNHIVDLTDKTDRTRYFECFCGTPVLKCCPYDLIYDPILRVCT